jgi:hypothetical protein
VNFLLVDTTVVPARSGSTSHQSGYLLEPRCGNRIPGHDATRELDAAAIVAYGGIGIPLATAGFGVWSLVVATLSQRALLAVLWQFVLLLILYLPL